MVVRVCFRVLRQFQFRHDLVDDSLVVEDAPVSEKCESSCLHVVYHPSTGSLFVLHLDGNGSDSLILPPHLSVTPSMGQMIPVWFGLTERCAIDERLAIDHPENADTGLFLPMECWFVNFGNHTMRLLFP